MAVIQPVFSLKYFLLNKKLIKIVRAPKTAEKNLALKADTPKNL
jgi:hypothetical protein